MKTAIDWLYDLLCIRISPEVKLVSVTRSRLHALTSMQSLYYTHVQSGTFDELTLKVDLAKAH